MLYMSLFSPKGKGQEAITYLKKLKASKGITIRDVYVSLGRYDAVVIFEATDPRKAMRFAMDTGIATGYLVETLNVIPVREA